MKSILLRKVPEDLHREVKAAAAHAGKSMQDLIIETLAEKTAGHDQNCGGGEPSAER